LKVVVTLLLQICYNSVSAKDNKFSTSLGAVTAFGTSKYGEIAEISLRPKGVYKFNPYFELHGGMRFYGVKDFEEALSWMELRPWQGLRLQTKKVGLAKFRSLFRLEERYFMLSSDEEDYFTGRFRARMDYNIKFKESSGFCFPLGIESFSPFDDDTPGIIPEKYRLEAIVQYQFPDHKTDLKLRSYNYWEDLNSDHNYEFDATFWSLQLSYIF